MSDEVEVHDIRGEVICKIEMPVTLKDNLLSLIFKRLLSVESELK